MAIKLSFKSLLVIAIAITALCSTSCLRWLLEDINDNRELYNTEWSTKEENEGLKFYNNDKVLFFNALSRGSGTFEYDAESGYITFTNLSVAYGSSIAEFPGAKIESDGTMTLYWHELGKSKNYYEILYKRR